MVSDFRLAIETWNTYYRASATIARGFSDADIWEGLLTSEYAVLYALSTEPEGLRMSQLNEDALLTQPGMSRLIVRLEARGLVQRRDDNEDARARRICITQEGTQLQRRVGISVARSIADVMQRALTREQMLALGTISQALLDSATTSATAPTRENGTQ